MACKSLVTPGRLASGNFRQIRDIGNESFNQLEKMAETVIQKNYPCWLIAEANKGCLWSASSNVWYLCFVCSTSLHDPPGSQRFVPIIFLAIPLFPSLPPCPLFLCSAFFSSFRTPYLLTLAFFSHCCSAGMWRLCVPPAAPGREGGLWKRRWPWRLREKSWLIAQTRIISP